MRRIFHMDGLSGDFDRDGYVLIPDFLNGAEIARLVSFYGQQDTDLRKGFHATMHSHRTAYRRRVFEEITAVFLEKADKLLRDCRPVTASYTVKEPGPESSFDFHLDWSMVDERQFRSITIWVPLVDMNSQNGNLWVLRGSHELGYTIRGGPQLFLWTEKPWEEIGSARYAKDVMALRAGVAVIYDHRLIHGSPANLSSRRRLAINYACLPVEAAPLHYERREEGRLEVFEVDPDFYNRVIMGKPATEGKLVQELRVSPQYLRQAQVNSLCIEEMEDWQRKARAWKGVES